MKITLKTALATKKFAAQLAKKILETGPDKHAKVLALTGNLGAGKTTFIQGFIKALGIRTRVTSPTFLIFRPYSLPKKSHWFRFAIHADLYRIRSFAELKSLGFKKILERPRNIVLIEWAEKIKKYLPRKTLWINLNPGQKENTREIAITKKP